MRSFIAWIWEPSAADTFSTSVAEGESPSCDSASPARSWSMEVKERVITMLFSSAVGSAMVRSQNLESSESTAQVMPMVAKCRLFVRKSAARTASEVFPEREITTTCKSATSSWQRFGNSNISDAGRARVRRPVVDIQAVAADSARYRLEPHPTNKISFAAASRAEADLNAESDARWR